MIRQDTTVLLVGLLCRVALAMFAAHPYDLTLFATSQRLYYQLGYVDLRFFPTLPAIYYIQLVFYAPYALLTSLGVPDYQFLYHTTFMIEGLFLKLPMIVADVGSFLVLKRLTKQLLPSALFFLNPFMIFLTAAWGIYDGLMIFPLLLGFYLVSTDGSRTMTIVAFVASGLIKLFGFAPYAMLLVSSLLRKRFRRFASFATVGIVITTIIVAPFLISGGFQLFTTGIISGFVGTSTVAYSYPKPSSYNLIQILSGINLSFFTPIALALVVLGYVIDSRRVNYGVTQILLVKWCFIGAVAFNVVSGSEPQWLSWTIPLGILYGFLTGRSGIQYFSFIFGIAATFFTMTLLQSSGYILTGTGMFLLSYVEGFSNSVIFYSALTFILLTLLSAYAFIDRMKHFRVEVIPLVMLLYFQAYFWIVVVGIQNL